MTVSRAKSNAVALQTHKVAGAMYNSPIRGSPFGVSPVMQSYHTTQRKRLFYPGNKSDTDGFGPRPTKIVADRETMADTRAVSVTQREPQTFHGHPMVLRSTRHCTTAAAVEDSPKLAVERKSGGSASGSDRTAHVSGSGMSSPDTLKTDPPPGFLLTASAEEVQAFYDATRARCAVHKAGRELLRTAFASMSTCSSDSK
jgi:hypothetical protein